MRCLVILFLLNSYFTLAQNNKENILGMNTNTVFIFFDINDTTFLNRVKKINPKVLRFPGGYGNFYHIEGSGYGFKLNEADRSNNGNLPKRIRGLNRIISQQKVTGNYIDEFIQLTQELNAKVIIDANIITAPSTEIIQIIQKLKENNINILGIELGNELYNTSFSNIIEGEKYVKIAKQFSEDIKSKFPNLKIGVIAAPLNRKLRRHSIWNDLLIKEDFYDAIIIHSYAKVIKGIDEAGQMIKEVSESVDKKRTFEIYRDRILKFLKISYGNEIAAYNSLFNNKPIWLTEWNLQMSRTTGNTMFQSLFVSSFLLELASNKQLKNINLSIYHNLAGRDVSGSIFMMDNKKMITHSTYFPFTIVNSFFENEGSNISRKMINQYCFEYTAALSQDDNKSYIWLNWSENSISISKDSICKEIELIEFFGSSLFQDNNTRKLKYKTSKIDNNDEVILRPFSITLCKCNYIL